MSISTASAQAIALPTVSKLSPRVMRLLGCNPGPMTLGGTNTYLLGTGKDRILIDTGEGGRAEFVAALREATTTCESCSSQVAHVVLTHWHHDHHGGVADVCSLFPNCRLWKKPSRSDRLMNLPSSFTASPSSSSSSSPCAGISQLQEGACVKVEGATLRAVATPGHTDDHVCLWLEEERALFTGDTILGAGSSVFACYADFMQSLDTLLKLKPRTLYPGHGPAIGTHHDDNNSEKEEEGEAVEKIRQYIAHRNKREEQILGVFKRPHGKEEENGEEASFSAVDIVKIVYVDTPPKLHEAAAINVVHHLKKLFCQGIVIPIDDEGLETVKNDDDYAPPSQHAQAHDDPKTAKEQAAPPQQQHVMQEVDVDHMIMLTGIKWRLARSGDSSSSSKAPSFTAAAKY